MLIQIQVEMKQMENRELDRECVRREDAQEGA